MTYFIHFDRQFNADSLKISFLDLFINHIEFFDLNILHRTKYFSM